MLHSILTKRQLYTMKLLMDFRFNSMLCDEVERSTSSNFFQLLFFSL
jgi:hypothetical protein